MKTISIAVTLICLILASAGVSGCAKPGPGPSPAPSPAPSAPIDEYAIELARRFCPVIHLNNEAENNEFFEPDPVELIVDLSILRDVSNPSFSEKPALNDLVRWSQSAYYLDIADLAPKPESIEQYKNAYDSVKNQYEPTIYARIVEAEGDGHTIIQYWLFYYLNDWRNVHEGDWELIQLHFDGLSTQDLLSQQKEPLLAAYSQHQGGQKMSWAEMKNTGLIRDTHPLVYVAKGSHANYFTPGQFWSGLDFDDTGLSPWRVIEPEELNVVAFQEDGGIEWIGFQGRWGEYLGLFISFLDLRFGQQGPFGPQWGEDGQQSKKWRQPQDWAAGLPEYPKPFWTSFIKLPGDWSKLAVFSVFSPADLHVYDSTGRHIGLDETGDLEIQIPGAMYIVPEGTDYKTILVPGADVGNEYRMEVKGTGSGMMDIRAQIPDVQTGIRRFLEYLKVPVTLKTIARAVIKPEELLVAPRLAPTVEVAPAATARDMSTKLEIDSNGDGIFEMESIPGIFEEKKMEKSPPVVPEQTTPPAPAPLPSRRDKELQAMPFPDFYLIKVMARDTTGENYIGEINPEFDRSFNEPFRFQISYSPDFSGLRIGDPYYFEGQLRTPPAIGEFFEVKGILWKPDNRLEIMNFKQNIYFQKAFSDYRETLFLCHQAATSAAGAQPRYDALFDSLPQNKCVYYSGGALGVPLPPEPPSVPGYVPKTPEEIARYVVEQRDYAGILYTYLKGEIARIDELVIQDCREELRYLLEDRESPESIMARVNRSIEHMKRKLSNTTDQLERIMLE